MSCDTSRWIGIAINNNCDIGSLLGSEFGGEFSWKGANILINSSRGSRKKEYILLRCRGNS